MPGKRGRKEGRSILSEAEGHFIDLHITVHEAPLIQALDSPFTRLVVHFDIATTHGVTRFTVDHDTGRDYFAKLQKELEEVVGSRFFVEVTNKYVHKNGI